MTEELQIRLTHARREHNEARADVNRWMDDQAKAGILTYAGDAPGWPRYERACSDWNAALREFDDAIGGGAVTLARSAG